MDGVTVAPYRSFGGLRHSQSLNNISSLSSPQNNHRSIFEKVR
jgi:hypothetical protein